MRDVAVQVLQVCRHVSRMHAHGGYTSTDCNLYLIGGSWLVVAWHGPQRLAAREELL